MEKKDIQFVNVYGNICNRSSRINDDSEESMAFEKELEEALGLNEEK